MSPPADPLEAAIARAWPRAQAHWSPFLLMSPPIDDSQQPSVAHIHLGTRQVALHHQMIRERNLTDCVEAILAHEVGHHVRYPGTMAVQARLRLLERSLLPYPDYSVINLFTDLMINETLGHELRDQLARVYQAFIVQPAQPANGDNSAPPRRRRRAQGEEAPAESEPTWERDPAFLFYLAIYEELWQMEPGALMGPDRPAFEQAYPDYRADAQVVAQDLFNLGPNLYTQFLYFVSVISRYIPPRQGQQPCSMSPYACGCGQPSPDDWAEALTPSAYEREAIERALREGWLREEGARRLRDDQAMERRIRGLPGVESGDAAIVPEVMAAYYRQQAERYLLEPPPQKVLGDAIVPTTLDDWEPGDPIKDVDWLTTLVQRGPVWGGAQPLQRQRIADAEGFDVPLWQPRIEIYLDVSGSMPDPRKKRNAMTLAAQILSTGAIRAGGWVRALLYSGAPVSYWQWCRSEVEMSKFLMHYIGGGTVFPFEILRKSVEECATWQPVRVVITDTDFDHNYQSRKEHATLFAEAVGKSPHFVLLLHRPQEARVQLYSQVGARVVRVPQLEDYPRMAAALAHALFDQEKKHAAG
jgi:hypothetical protein